jgi:hypothetical protein
VPLRQWQEVQELLREVERRHDGLTTSSVNGVSRGIQQATAQLIVACVLPLLAAAHVSCRHRVRRPELPDR